MNVVTSSRYNKTMPLIKTGTYRHYKNQDYEVYGICHHSETQDALVIYRCLYGKYDLWVRPLSMFQETVIVDGLEKPRFTFISDELRYAVAGQVDVED